MLHRLFAGRPGGEFAVRCTSPGCGAEAFRRGALGWECARCARAVPPGLAVARTEEIGVMPGCEDGECPLPGSDANSGQHI